MNTPRESSHNCASCRPALATPQTPKGGFGRPGIGRVISSAAFDRAVRRLHGCVCCQRTLLPRTPRGGLLRPCRRTSCAGSATSSSNPPFPLMGMVDRESRDCKRERGGLDGRRETARGDATTPAARSGGECATSQDGCRATPCVVRQDESYYPKS